MSANEYFDLEDAAKRLNGDKSILKMLINMFLDGKDIPLLETALNEREYKTAEEYSHAIKGIAGNLSLTLLFDVVTRLNHELKQGKPSDQTIEEYYSAVRGTTETLRSVLTTL